MPPGPSWGQGHGTGCARRGRPRLRGGRRSLGGRRGVRGSCRLRPRQGGSPARGTGACLPRCRRAPGGERRRGRPPRGPRRRRRRTRGGGHRLHRRGVLQRPCRTCGWMGLARRRRGIRLVAGPGSRRDRPAPTRWEGTEEPPALRCGLPLPRCRLPRGHRLHAGPHAGPAPPPRPRGPGAPVSWTGGLLSAGDILLGPFTRALAPGLVPTPPAGTPLDGAFLAAARALNL